MIYLSLVQRDPKTNFIWKVPTIETKAELSSAQDWLIWFKQIVALIVQQVEQLTDLKRPPFASNRNSRRLKKLLRPVNRNIILLTLTHTHWLTRAHRHTHTCTHSLSHLNVIHRLGLIHLKALIRNDIKSKVKTVKDDKHFKISCWLWEAVSEIFV